MGEWVRVGLGLVVLLAIAVTVLGVARVAQRRAVLIASGRAVVQLAFVALALRGVFTHPPFVVLVLAVMFGVAVWTAGRRLGGRPAGGWGSCRVPRSRWPSPAAAVRC